MMRWILVVWSMVVLFPCAATAQNIDSETAETIRALKQEVKELRARVTALEARPGPPSPEKEQQPPPSTASEPAKSQEPAAGREAETLNPERVFGIFPGIKI